MHKAIREHFPQLESKTEDGENPEEKVISVQYIEKKTSRHGEKYSDLFCEGKIKVVIRFCEFIFDFCRDGKGRCVFYVVINTLKNKLVSKN